MDFSAETLERLVARRIVHLEDALQKRALLSALLTVALVIALIVGLTQEAEGAIIGAGVLSVATVYAAYMTWRPWRLRAAYEALDQPLLELVSRVAGNREFQQQSHQLAKRIYESSVGRDLGERVLGKPIQDDDAYPIAEEPDTSDVLPMTFKYATLRVELRRARFAVDGSVAALADPGSPWFMPSIETDVRKTNDRLVAGVDKITSTASELSAVAREMIESVDSSRLTDIVTSALVGPLRSNFAGSQRLRMWVNGTERQFPTLDGDRLELKSGDEISVEVQISRANADGVETGLHDFARPLIVTGGEDRDSVEHLIRLSSFGLEPMVATGTIRTSDDEPVGYLNLKHRASWAAESDHAQIHTYQDERLLQTVRFALSVTEPDQ